jgi:SAM-dependent methyltransferase/ketosteroid isomerase-like protein
VESRGAENDQAFVEKTIRDSIGWALTKDRPLLESVLSHDADLFIFHPDSKSTIVGWDDFVKLFDVWMDPRFKATHFEVRDLRIHFSNSRDIAWYSAILDDCGEWDGKPNCWKNARWTGVLEKRDGQWTIVQMHFSLASDAVRSETSSRAKREPARWDAAPKQEPPFEIEAWEKRLNKRQPPVKIMDAIGAAPGRVIGEIGAGTGRMTLWLAERVGPSGKVYANDIDKENLEGLRKRGDREGFTNIETILGEVENPKLPAGELDVAFMINVYHHLDFPLPLIRNIIPSLKPSGVLAIVECDPDKVDWGKEEGCHTKDVMLTELEEGGFEVVRVETFLNEDNIYIARPLENNKESIDLPPVAEAQNDRPKNDVERTFRETPPQRHPDPEVDGAKDHPKQYHRHSQVTEDRPVSSEVEGQNPKQSAHQGVEQRRRSR